MARTIPADRFVEHNLDRTDHVVAQLSRIARPLADSGDLDPLLDRIADARYVLLGEASHGTSDFYTWRTRLSQRLLREKGFSFIAVEGDWPDCYRVNRYIGWRPDAGASAYEVLRSFDRWPTWMWANRETVELVEALRSHNLGLPSVRRAGFYGLDVYSLWDSMRAVIVYLDRVDPEAGRRARHAYECFAPYGEDVQAYAWATALVPASCADEVARILADLRRRMPHSTDNDRDGHFDAEQNALVAQNAELYYRTMVLGGAASWNVRDSHMVETLERLMWLHGPHSKAIVWAHNTHVGDARYTDMGDQGEINVGQIVRQRHARDGVVLVGFSTYRGRVIAGDEWEAPMKSMPVPPGRPGSVEDVLHRIGNEDKLLMFSDVQDSEALLDRRGHRAIGVVYRPEHEHYGNYVPTVLPRRYDALLYVDTTKALSPLHMPERPELELPETYPTGM